MTVSRSTCLRGIAFNVESMVSLALALLANHHRNLALLIVKRQVGESIVIADNIVVTVIGRRGDTVQLGIEAPHETLVLREELTVGARTPNISDAEDKENV